MKINIYKILSFLLYHSLFLNIIYIKNYNYISSILVALLFIIFFLIYLQNIKLFKRYNKVNASILFFIILNIFSASINISETASIPKTIFFSISIATSFLGFEIFDIKEIKQDVIKQYFHLTLFYLIVTDIVLFIFPNLYIEKGYYYLIGNKFRVSYMHAFCAVSSLSIFKNNKKVPIMLLIISILVSLKVYCLTGIVYDMIILLMLIMYNEKKDKISAKKAILTLIFSGLIIIFFSEIINIKFIYNIINSLPGKTSTIFGRLNIYSNVYDIIKERLFFGHGYNTSFDILMGKGIGVNTQNSVLELLFQFGLFGLVSVIIIIWNCLKNRKCSMLEYGIYSIIIGLFIISCIEITFDKYMFIYLAMMNTAQEPKRIGGI